MFEILFISLLRKPTDSAIRCVATLRSLTPYDPSLKMGGFKGNVVHFITLKGKDQSARRAAPLGNRRFPYFLRFH